jgi:DNA-binding NtrC family response regulator
MTNHILHIDDEAAIRELLAQFLVGNGYRVTSVDSAAEAFRAVKCDPPNLIISDLQLEDSDGLEMIERLNAMLPDTPVILLTGVLFDAQVARNALGTKVSSYVEKTTSLARILEEIQHLLKP